MPSIGAFQRTVDRREGYGTWVKQAIKEEYGAFVSLEGLGEMIPNERSYCEIDPGAVDQWGIPVLRFYWTRGEAEVKQAQHMQQTFRAIIESMGGTIVGTTPISAGPFVSSPEENPTHTIVALAWRTAEYLAEEMRNGMSEPSRRDLLRTVAAAAMAATSVDSVAAQAAHDMVATQARAAAGGAYTPRALSQHEYRTLERLTDLLLPAERGSPGALDAGAAAWIDLLAYRRSQRPELAAGVRFFGNGFLLGSGCRLTSWSTSTSEACAS